MEDERRRKVNNEYYLELAFAHTEAYLPRVVVDLRIDWACT